MSTRHLLARAAPTHRLASVFLPARASIASEAAAAASFTPSPFRASISVSETSTLLARLPSGFSTSTSSSPGISFSKRKYNTMTNGPSLTDAVLKAVKSLYPEALADKAWDNTGLLVGEAPSFKSATSSTAQGTVLLTNDLTAAVVDEALHEGAKVIICYHPVIFRPLKSITTDDPMQAQLLRLIAAGVSVYCPHTAVDAASGGLNDWLCDLLLDGDEAASKTVVQPIKGSLPEDHKGCGYGRTVEFSNALGFSDLLKRFSKGIGGHRYMMVALPTSYKKDISAIPPISKAAVCAGSGSSVLSGTDAQVLVTGEMSHHDALRHASLGHIVVTVFHSNSERQYLTQRMKPMLEEALKDSPHANTRVVVSTADSDPFDVIDVESL